MTKSNILPAQHQATISPEKLPPHSIEIEQAALGCILWTAVDHPDEAGRMISQLRKPDFYDLRHQTIFAALRCLAVDRKSLIIESCQQWLKDKGELENVGGLAYLAGLTGTPSAFEDHVATLREKSAHRELIKQGTLAIERGYDESLPCAGMANEFLTLAGKIAASASEAGDTARLTVRTPNEILAMTFADDDCIWGDRILAAGQSLTFIGQGGIGKSRLLLQGAVAQITGRNFLCFENRGLAKRWLFLQAENSNRRLQDDLKPLEKWVGPDDWKKVCENLFIHTLESDIDEFLSLADPGAIRRLENVIETIRPDIVPFDALYNFSMGDLNKDQDMMGTLQIISRTVRKGDSQRMIIPLHHSLTGQAGAAKSVGYDRSSFGRNSKALYQWTRAQINIAPGSPDENPPLVISCGKNNNGKAFPTFVAQLNPETMIYEVDSEFDVGAWTDEIQKSRGGRNPAYDPKQLLASIADSTPENPVSTSAWATAANVPRTSLSEYLPKLRSMGWIATVGEGSNARKYITPEGRKAALKKGRNKNHDLATDDN